MQMDMKFVNAVASPLSRALFPLFCFYSRFAMEQDIITIYATTILHATAVDSTCYAFSPSSLFLAGKTDEFKVIEAK